MDRYLHAEDVMSITGYKESKSKKIIKELNKELKEKGYIIFPGRVSEKYFQKRCFPSEETNE